MPLTRIASKCRHKECIDFWSVYLRSSNVENRAPVTLQWAITLTNSMKALFLNAFTRVCMGDLDSHKIVYSIFHLIRLGGCWKGSNRTNRRTAYRNPIEMPHIHSTVSLEIALAHISRMWPNYVNIRSLAAEETTNRLYPVTDYINRYMGRHTGMPYNNNTYPMRLHTHTQHSVSAQWKIQCIKFRLAERHLWKFIVFRKRLQMRNRRINFKCQTSLGFVLRSIWMANP